MENDENAPSSELDAPTGPTSIHMTSRGVEVSLSPEHTSPEALPLGISPLKTTPVKGTKRRADLFQAKSGTFPPRLPLKNIGNTPNSLGNIKLNPTKAKPGKSHSSPAVTQKVAAPRPNFTSIASPGSSEPEKAVPIVASPETPKLRGRVDEETGVTPLLNTELALSPRPSSSGSRSKDENVTRNPLAREDFVKPSTPSLSKLFSSSLAKNKTPDSGGFQLSRRKSRGEKRSLSYEVPDENSPLTSKRRPTNLLRERGALTSINETGGFAAPLPPPARPLPRPQTLSRPEHRPTLQRSFSEANADIIRRACTMLDKNNLTADTLLELALPTMKDGAKHSDLNTIDCHTLVKLMKGEFKDVDSFEIIDARYPYEYVGGHIRGAKNFGFFDEEKFFEEYLPEGRGRIPRTEQRHSMEESAKSRKRHVIVFHCEFSSQRGPGLLRELRKRDRTLNAESYPLLYYPEMYILHLGYKEFFNNYKEHCSPNCYVTMADPNYSAEERSFRQKSKSWSGGTTCKKGSRPRFLKH